MRKMMIAFVAMAALPSCMHPAERAFEARTANNACLVDAEGRISQGACDKYGRYSADRGVGLTLGSPVVASPPLAVSDELQ